MPPGPLPSRGRPSGSMTRPSNPSPTAMSMTRPVRWTSSPAWIFQKSPSRRRQFQSASTLSAIPSTSPGMFTNSSKPTPGRPDTLAIPVATLITVAYFAWYQLRGECFACLGLFQQTHYQKHSGGSQVPFSSALFPMARSGFGFRLGLAWTFRAGPVFGF